MAHAGNAPGLPLPQHIVTQFPSPTWVENIAVRANGDLLVTHLSPNASLFSVSEPTTSTPTVNSIHVFESETGLLGIAEPKPDFFVVASVFYPDPANPMVSVCTAWGVDFEQSGNPKVDKIATLPDAKLLNGATALPGCGEAVLMADSMAGLVWRLDVNSGKAEIAVQVPEMAGLATSPVGINGIKIYQEHLYWTNSADKTIYRIKITDQGYRCDGAVTEKIVQLDAKFLDDFAIDGEGVIWVATNYDHRLFAVQPSTKKAIVVEGEVTEMTLAGDTAAAFGRGEGDKDILYVVTNGGLRMPVNGTLIEGGKIAAVDTKGFNFS